MSSGDSTTYYLALDIEREGDDFEHAVTAIGAVLGPADGSWARDKLWRFRGNLQPLPGQVQDPACMSEFWSKHTAVYAEIKAAARPAANVMSEFLAWCQQAVAAFEDTPAAEDRGHIVIVTDCPDEYGLPSSPLSLSFSCVHVTSGLSSGTLGACMCSGACRRRRGRARCATLEACGATAGWIRASGSVRWASRHRRHATRGSRPRTRASCTTTAPTTMPSTRTTR